MKRVIACVALLVAMLGSGAPSLVTVTAQESPSPATLDDPPACATALFPDATPSAESATGRPDWQTITMTDARTGKEFAISDFLGCTIYVEPMATWCVNCKMQLFNVAEALPQLDRDKYVVIAISVETELSLEDLKQYTETGEFGWTFSVASPDMLKAIVDEFGRDVVVPPSTPHFLIHPDGTYGELQTGGKSPEGIIEFITGTGE